MDGALFLLGVCLAAGSGLIAWRWWLDEQTKRATAAHAHALAMRTQRLELDAKELDELRAQVKSIQLEMRTAQYGKR